MHETSGFPRRAAFVCALLVSATLVAEHDLSRRARSVFAAAPPVAALTVATVPALMQELDDEEFDVRSIAEARLTRYLNRSKRDEAVITRLTEAFASATSTQLIRTGRRMSYRLLPTAPQVAAKINAAVDAEALALAEVLVAIYRHPKYAPLQKRYDGAGFYRVVDEINAGMNEILEDLEKKKKLGKLVLPKQRPMVFVDLKNKRTDHPAVEMTFDGRPIEVRFPHQNNGLVGRLVVRANRPTSFDDFLTPSQRKLLASRGRLPPLESPVPFELLIQPDTGSLRRRATPASLEPLLSLFTELSPTETYGLSDETLLERGKKGVWAPRVK